MNVADEAVTQGQKLRIEYLKKIGEADGNEFLKGRAIEWLLDSTIKLTKDVRDENQRLVEASLRK